MLLFRAKSVFLELFWGGGGYILIFFIIRCALNKESDFHYIGTICLKMSYFT